jgi:hypothetical protein
VILFLRGNPVPYRRAGALVLLTLATVVYGCGSSGSSNPADGKASGTAPEQLLKDEQLYKYVGEGKDKHKEAISIRERARLIREAKKAP